MLARVLARVLARALAVRQKQRDRVASGGMILQSDYTISEGSGGLDIGRLAVRTGAESGFGPRRSPSPEDNAAARTGSGDGAHSGREGVAIGDSGHAAGDDEAEGSDEAIARAVVVEVVSSWRKLAAPLQPQLRVLSLGVLAACAANEKEKEEGEDKEEEEEDEAAVSPEGQAGGKQEEQQEEQEEEQAVEGREESFAAAVHALFSPGGPTSDKASGDKAGNAKAQNEAGKTGEKSKKSGGDGKAGPGDKGKAANSRFALAKMAIARSIARSHRSVGAVRLLRALLTSRTQQQRFLGSLLIAGLALSAELAICAQAASECVELLEDAMRGVVPVQPSLLAEATTLLSVRASRHGASSGHKNGGNEANGGDGSGGGGDGGGGDGSGGRLILNMDVVGRYLQPLLSHEDDAGNHAGLKLWTSHTFPAATALLRAWLSFLLPAAKAHATAR